MYLGPDKIETQVDEGDYVRVSLEGGKSAVLKKKLFELVRSEQKSDHTMLRDQKNLLAMQDIVKVLLDWDIKIEDTESIFVQTSNFLNQKLQQSNAKLWKSHLKTKFPDGTIPETILGERTVGDLNAVLETK